MLGIGTGVYLKKVKNNVGKTIQKNYVWRRQKKRKNTWKKNLNTWGNIEKINPIMC